MIFALSGAFLLCLVMYFVRRKLRKNKDLLRDQEIRRLEDELKE